MTETPLHGAIARMAVDPAFARAVREDPDVVAAELGLGPDEMARLSALVVDTSAPRPAKLEERLSRSALFFGGDMSVGDADGGDSGGDSGGDDSGGGEDSGSESSSSDSSSDDTGSDSSSDDSSSDDSSSDDSSSDDSGSGDSDDDSRSESRADSHSDGSRSDSRSEPESDTSDEAESVSETRSTADADTASTTAVNDTSPDTAPATAGAPTEPATTATTTAPADTSGATLEAEAADRSHTTAASGPADTSAVGTVADATDTTTPDPLTSPTPATDGGAGPVTAVPTLTAAPATGSMMPGATGPTGDAAATTATTAPPPFVPADPDAGVTTRVDAQGNQVTSFRTDDTTSVVTMRPDGTGERIDTDARGAIVDRWTVADQPDGSVVQTNAWGDRTTFYPDGRSVAETKLDPAHPDRSWSRTETWPDGHTLTTSGGVTPATDTAPAERWTTTVEKVPETDGGWRQATLWSDGRSEQAYYAPDGDLTGFSRTVPDDSGGTWTTSYDEWGRQTGTNWTDERGNTSWGASVNDRPDDGQWDTPWGEPVRSVETNFPPQPGDWAVRAEAGYSGQVQYLLVDRSEHREVTTERYPDGSTITRTTGWRAPDSAMVGDQDFGRSGQVGAPPSAWEPYTLETVHTQHNPDGSITVRTDTVSPYSGATTTTLATYDAEGRMTMRGDWDEAGFPTQETFEYLENGGYSRTTYGDDSNIIYLYDANDIMTGGYVWDHETGWGLTWSGSDQIGPTASAEPAPPPEPLRIIPGPIVSPSLTLSAEVTSWSSPSSATDAASGAVAAGVAGPAVVPAVSGFHHGTVHQLATTNADGTQAVRVTHGDGTTSTLHRATDPLTGANTDTHTDADGGLVVRTWSPAGGLDSTDTTAPDGTTTRLAVQDGRLEEVVARPDGTSRTTSWGDDPAALFTSTERGPLGDAVTTVRAAEAGGLEASVRGADGSTRTEPVAESRVDHPDGSTSRIFTVAGGETHAFVVGPDGEPVYHQAGDGASENPYVRPAVTPAVADALAAAASDHRGGIVGQQVDGDAVTYTYGDGTTETAQRSTDPATGHLTDRITRADGTTWTHTWDPATGPATGLWTTTAPDGTTTTLSQDGTEGTSHTERPDGATVDVRVLTPDPDNDHLLFTIDETAADLTQQYLEVHVVPGTSSVWVQVTGPDGAVTSHGGGTIHHVVNPDGSRTSTVVLRDGDTLSATVRDGRVVGLQSETHDGTAVPGERDITDDLPAPVQQVVDRGMTGAHGQVVSHEVVEESVRGTTVRVTHADGTTDELVRRFDHAHGLASDTTTEPDGTTTVLMWRRDADGAMTADQTTATHPDGTVVTTYYENSPDRSFTEITQRPDGSRTEVVGYSTYVPADDGQGWNLYRVEDTDPAGLTTVTTYGWGVPGVDGAAATTQAPDGTRTVVPVWIGSRDVGTTTYSVIVRPDGTTDTFASAENRPRFDGYSGPSSAHWTTPPVAGAEGPAPAVPGIAPAVGEETGEGLAPAPHGPGSPRPYLSPLPDAHPVTPTYDADGTEHSSVFMPDGTRQERTIRPDGTGTRVDWDRDPYGDRGGDRVVATWTIARQPDGSWIEARDPVETPDQQTATSITHRPDGSSLSITRTTSSDGSSTTTVATSADGRTVTTTTEGEHRGWHTGDEGATSYTRVEQVTHPDGSWSDTTSTSRTGPAVTVHYDDRGTVVAETRGLVADRNITLDGGVAVPDNTDGTAGWDRMLGLLRPGVSIDPIVTDPDGTVHTTAFDHGLITRRTIGPDGTGTRTDVTLASVGDTVATWDIARRPDGTWVETLRPGTTNTLWNHDSVIYGADGGRTEIAHPYQYHPTTPGLVEVATRFAPNGTRLGHTDTFGDGSTVSYDADGQVTGRAGPLPGGGEYAEASSRAPDAAVGHDSVHPSRPFDDPGSTFRPEDQDGLAGLGRRAPLEPIAALLGDEPGGHRAIPLDELMSPLNPQPLPPVDVEVDDPR